MSSPTFSALLAVLASSLFVLSACASEQVETRRGCNHHCSAVYEACSERSRGGNTLNDCGYENMRCNALCPAR